MSYANPCVIEPLVKVIPYQDPLYYVESLGDLNNLVLLESARLHPHYGRYSFIAFDPSATVSYQKEGIFFNDQLCNSNDIFVFLAEQLSHFHLKAIPDLPPFQGGLAGFLSYDLGRDLEKLPHHAVDDQQYPLLMAGFYDLVVSFDHAQKKAWLISSGLPEKEFDRRKNRAVQRLIAGCNVLQRSPEKKKIVYPEVQTKGITSNFSEGSYKKAVQKVIEYILAGDIFEANLSQRFKCQLPRHVSEIDLYRQLRKINPAPFAAYLKFKQMAIVSSSPERFLKLSEKEIETRPMKGTVLRSKNPLEDLRLGQELLASEKDRAENTMIVDLMRNDLSKVCEPHTVKVPQHCGLESFETVHHLVSVVQGRLEAQYGPIDLLKAAFPGGSVTGAPKVRAMEIIDELEPTRRGPYCGSAGYIGFDGCMDLSILIRTYVISNQTITFQAGGAVVLDSDPQKEYEETLLKAKALIRALTETQTESERVGF